MTKIQIDKMKWELVGSFRILGPIVCKNANWWNAFNGGDQIHFLLTVISC